MTTSDSFDMIKLEKMAGRVETKEERFIEELDKAIAFHRDNENAPHAIAPAVICALYETRAAFAKAYGLPDVQTPCQPGEVSDGFHTFNELYEHRNMLFLALMKAHSYLSWVSMRHADNTMFPGWFIAGMNLPTGNVTYHMPERLWVNAGLTGASVLAHAPAWDGHIPSDVVYRLQLWLGQKT